MQSLHVVNPAPFVDKVVPLALRKIPGFGVSLIQLIGSSLVGYSRTKSQKKSVSDRISPERKAMIEQLVLKLKLDVRATPKTLKSKLTKAGLRDITKEEIAYARFTIRMNEKQDFIDYLGQGLGNDKLKGMIDLFCKVAPPLMREFAKVGSLSSLLQCVFELLDNCMNSLRANFEGEKSKSDPVVKQRIVKEVLGHLMRFVKWFYPHLHKIALKTGTSKEAVVIPWLVDICFAAALEAAEFPALVARFHQGVKSHLDSLDEERRGDAFAFAETVGQMSQAGRDERFWPLNKDMDSLVAFANAELREVILRLGVWDVVGKVYDQESLSKILL